MTGGRAFALFTVGVGLGVGAWAAAQGNWATAVCAWVILGLQIRGLVQK